MPRHPVYLNIYDFTTINTCLKLFGVAGYHTGIQLNGMQYCFCVIDSNPNITGVITIQPKLYLGETQYTEDQTQDLVEVLARKYTCGKYHMFNNNCNHFSDQMAKQLLKGDGIPKWLFNTTDCLKYVCCCLPQGFVSGLWAIQSIQEQEMRENVSLLRPYNK